MTSYFTRKEKNQLPVMTDNTITRTPTPDDNLIMARVEINNDICNGCKLCVDVCPASALEMTGEKSVAMVGENPNCIGCGDCIPICLPKAITISRFQQYKGLYKFIGRGKGTVPRQF